MTEQCGDRYEIDGISGRAWSPYDDGVINCCHVPMAFSPLRARMKREPVRGTLARYEERIVEVLGEARGTTARCRWLSP